MRLAKHHWIEVAKKIDHAVVEAHANAKRKSAQRLSGSDLLELAIDLEKTKGNATFEEAYRAVYHADDVKRRLEDIKQALTGLKDVITPKASDSPRYHSKNLAIKVFTDSDFTIAFDDETEGTESASVLGWARQIGPIINAIEKVESKYRKLASKSYEPDDEIMSDPLMSLDYKTVLAGSILHNLYRKHYPNGKLIGANDNSPSGETVFINLALEALEYENLSAKTISRHRTELNKR